MAWRLATSQESGSTCSGIDLDAASRDELIAFIVQQQAVIGRLERRIAQLEDKAKPGGPSGMPGLKPRSSPKSPAPQQSRKPRPHGFSRRRMAPTHRVEHAVESCPDCGTPLSGGWTHRTREVIDLPRVPAQVTEHVFIARVCPRCRRNCLPQAELDGAALGKQRLGVNLVSLIATLREEGEAAHPQHPMVSAHRPPVAPQSVGRGETAGCLISMQVSLIGHDRTVLNLPGGIPHEAVAAHLVEATGSPIVVRGVQEC